MASRTAVVTQPAGRQALITWSGLLLNDIGIGRKVADFPDKTFAVRGTFGAGGTVKLKGSMDSTDGNTDGTWHELVDPQGNAISKTSAAIEAVTENPVWIRPEITAGDGTTNLVVELLCVQGV